MGITTPKKHDDDIVDMANVLPEGKRGKVEIRHMVISDRDAARSLLRQAATGGREMAVTPGKIAQLLVDGGIMMSDTPHERDTNRELIRESRGHVLIGGLGLGMVVLPLLAKERVKTVTIVEKSGDVIALVEKHIRAAAGDNASKLAVVRGDIFTWKAPRGARYDTLYFDIWPTINRDNLVEMRRLHTRFRRRKAKPYSWMSSWLFEELKDGWY